MKCWLFNVAIDAISRSEALEACRKQLSTPNCHILNFLNAHCFNIAQTNSEYAAAIKESSLLLNDGIGVKLVSIIAGVELRENLNGTDFIPDLLRLTSEMGLSVYLLGGGVGVAEKAANAIEADINGVRIAGYRSGYFDTAEEAAVLDEVNCSGAQLVILGMGVPRQEIWAARYRSELTHARLVVSGGAILDFLSGTVPRAPGWLRHLRLEWFFRLCLEPRRMSGRYILGSIVLLGHILRLSLVPKPRQ